MNNQNLMRLSLLMKEEKHIDEGKLLKGLSLIRANRGLAGITVVCQRFTTLVDRYPELKSAAGNIDLTAELLTLKAIGELKTPHAHFTAEGLAPSKDRPLFPLSGDSGLCELLLMEAADLSDLEHQKNFERLLAWYAWQTFHYQARIQDQEIYRNYLEDDTADRINEGKGKWMYAASLAIRELGASEKADLCKQLVETIGPISEDGSLRLATLSRLAKRQISKFRSLDVQHALSTWGYDKATLTAAVQGVRKTIDHRLRHLLRKIWFEALQQARTVERLVVAEEYKRKICRVTVERYRSRSEITSVINEGGIQDGTTIDFHLKPPKAKKSKASVENEEDEPDEGESTEPDVTLFLGNNDDLVKAFFAAKSALHHIEMDNAMLAWPRWRLSTDAIRAVFELVRFHPLETNETACARLAIGLSLITGRALSEAVKPIFAIGAPAVEKDRPMGIDCADLTLHVLAGAPELKDDKAVPGLCNPHAKTIRLRLPEAWRELIGHVSIAPESARVHEEATGMAQQMLLSCATHLAISVRGVSGVLRLSVLERTAGDLGALKVITDASSVNLNNVIHYASYPRIQIEELWRGAVEAIVGPLGEVAPPLDPTECVGCPQAFQIESLRKRIGAVRELFEQAVDAQRWEAAFNSFTVYLALWLGLATAGRKSTQPVPISITPDGWALISDKARPDQSTNRIVPLTTNMVAMLEAYRSLVACLSIVKSELIPDSVTGGPLIPLMMFNAAGQLVPFQPKLAATHEQLKDLPWNWGRKLVRSEAHELSGRFRDAGLGHWVRGRHPWSLISTFSVPEFRRQWLSMQLRLEERLGFTVMAVRGLPPASDYLPCPLPQREAVQNSQAEDKAKRGIEEPLMSGDEIDRLLRTVDSGLYDLTFNDDAPISVAGLKLAALAIRRQIDRKGADVKRNAKEICNYIRIKTGIPLFSERVRARFEKNWLVNTVEFMNCARAMRMVVPAFLANVDHLPAPATDDKSRARELGLLIMVCIWRMGLAASSHLESMLKKLASDDPVLAVGELRLLVIPVKARRTRERMRRTVLLEPFAASYITVERHRIREMLAPIVRLDAAKRRARLETALRVYLESIGVQSGLTIGAMMSAVKQRIMLDSTPLLAAYASGEIFTEDLDDGEFRRLAGLTIRRKNIAPEQSPDDRFDDNTATVVPDDIYKKGSRAFVAKLCRFKSSYIGEWRNQIRENAKPNDAVERLLKSFALWSLEELVGGRSPSKLDEKQKLEMAKRLDVVGLGFLGLTSSQSGRIRVEETSLKSLIELSGEHFPARIQHGVWSSFRRFLNQLKEKQKAGEVQEIEIGDLGEESERHICAKYISNEETVRVFSLIELPRGGIGNPLNRQSASTVVKLASTAGPRRNECRMIRARDAQSDIIRVQPYDNETLKTPSSDRVIPASFVHADVAEAAARARENGHRQIVDATPDHHVDGQNYFDAINRILKAVTGDPDLSLHHWRHSTAGKIVLSDVACSVDMKSISDELPWLQDQLIDRARMSALMGNEGPGGHGLQACSALLGHQHATTSLRHYIHVLCILLFAYVNRADPIVLTRSFQLRIRSAASVKRWAHQVRRQSVKDSDKGCVVRLRMRNRLESEAEELFGKRSPVVKRAQSEPIVLVYRDDSKLEPTTIVETGSGALCAPQITQGLSIGFLERLDRAMRSSVNLTEIDTARIVEIMRFIAKIPSGKRGAREKPRHPLVIAPACDCPLPEELRSGLSVSNAETIVRWLEGVRMQMPDHYDWLMLKWLYATDSQQGLMRMDTEADLCRIKELSDGSEIILQVERAAIARSRSSAGKTKSVRRVRMLCRATAKNSRPRLRRRRSEERAAGAIRWVMTWASAVWLMHGDRALTAA